jgi:hypothetical protein
MGPSVTSARTRAPGIQAVFEETSTLDPYVGECKLDAAATYG